MNKAIPEPEPKPGWYLARNPLKPEHPTKKAPVTRLVGLMPGLLVFQLCCLAA
jgi:hypothetical protein